MRANVNKCVNLRREVQYTYNLLRKRKVRIEVYIKVMSQSTCSNDLHVFLLFYLVIYFEKGRSVAGREYVFQRPLYPLNMSSYIFCVHFCVLCVFMRAYACARKILCVYMHSKKFWNKEKIYIYTGLCKFKILLLRLECYSPFLSNLIKI